MVVRLQIAGRVDSRLPLSSSLQTHFSLLPVSIISINTSAVCKGVVNILVIALHGIQDKVRWSDSSNVDQNVDQLAKTGAEMQQGQCNLWGLNCQFLQGWTELRQPDAFSKRAVSLAK